MESSGLFHALKTPCPPLGRPDVIIDLRSPGLLHSSLCGGDASAGLTGNGNLFDLEFLGHVYAQFGPGRLGQTQNIGGCCHEGIALEFLHLEDPGRRVQDTPRHHLTADFLGPIVPPPEGDKDVVAKGNEDPVRVPISLGVEDIGPAFGVTLPVLPRLCLIHGGTGGSTGLSERSDLLYGDGQHVPIGERRPLLHLT